MSSEKRNSQPQVSAKALQRAVWDVPVWAAATRDVPVKIAVRKAKHIIGDSRRGESGVPTIGKARERRKREFQPTIGETRERDISDPEYGHKRR